MSAPEAGRPRMGPVVAAVAVRPRLWAAALAVALRMAPAGWWRRAPHLPAPDRRLWGFRMVTAYGDPDAPPRPSDVVAFLEWCRATRPLVGRRAAGRS